MAKAKATTKVEPETEQAAVVLLAQIQDLDRRIAKANVQLCHGSSAEQNSAHAELIALNQQRATVQQKLEAAKSAPDWRPDTLLPEDFYAR